MSNSWHFCYSCRESSGTSTIRNVEISPYGVPLLLCTVVFCWCCVVLIGLVDLFHNWLTYTGAILRLSQCQRNNFEWYCGYQFEVIMESIYMWNQNKPWTNCLGRTLLNAELFFIPSIVIPTGRYPSMLFDFTTADNHLRSKSKWHGYKPQILKVFLMIFFFIFQHAK